MRANVSKGIAVANISPHPYLNLCLSNFRRQGFLSYLNIAKVSNQTDTVSLSHTFTDSTAKCAYLTYLIEAAIEKKGNNCPRLVIPEDSVAMNSMQNQIQQSTPAHQFFPLSSLDRAAERYCAPLRLKRHTTIIDADPCQRKRPHTGYAVHPTKETT